MKNVLTDALNKTRVQKNNSICLIFTPHCSTTQEADIVQPAIARVKLGNLHILLSIRGLMGESLFGERRLTDTYFCGFPAIKLANFTGAD